LRARALSAVQSSWALGYAAAALVAGLMLRHYNWRYVFFVGIFPALVTLWIQRSVPESEMWREKKESSTKDTTRVSFSQIFHAKYLKTTIALLLLNFCGMFAWWGLFTWLPPYLSLPVSEGGRGLSVMNTTTLLVVLNLVGMFPGYFTFGWVADRLGRKKSFILYTGCAALLVPLYAHATSQWSIMILGAMVAFFGTGFFSGSGIIASEVFPTAVRARALGFTYNGARAMSSVAPLVIGYIAQSHGLGGAFYLCALGFMLAAIIATQLPETLGKALE
jgi:MFS family permease